MLDKMNGHKFLILGNHDVDNLVKYYNSLGFEGVFKNPIKLNGDYLSHEPLIEGEKEDPHFNLVVREFKNQVDKTNYHGHIHEKDYSSGENYVNCSCEAINYKPILIGKTATLSQSDSNNLFINSAYFDSVLEELQKNYGIEPSLLIEDYIYTTMLESSTLYKDRYFVQGSFALLKKYGYISKMSDLDISYLYNSLESKAKNVSSFRAIVDQTFKYLQSIDRIDLSFYKRYSSIRIFEALYSSMNSHYAKCDLDANLIFLDCYQKSDFISLSHNSLIENLLEKSDSHLLEDYTFPSYQSQFLVPEGDIANSLLQILFQQGFENKKSSLMRKLIYVYDHAFKNKEMINFQDIFMRFYLRNIALLYTLHRYSEIEYIKEVNPNISFSSSLPRDLNSQISDILCSSNSEFLYLHKEMSHVSVDEIFDKCTEMVKELKRK